mgnify:CR=1 FL=1
MSDLDLEIYNARVAYLDAAIAEINAVCNVVEATDETKKNELRQLAQLTGDNAQQKFDAFSQLCDRRNVGHAN